MNAQLALKRIALTTLLALALPAAGHAMPPPPDSDRMAGSGPHGMPPFAMMAHGPDLPLPPFLRGLSLSEAQEDKIFDIFNDQAKLVRERMKTMEKTEAALMELTFAPDYDEAKVRGLIELQVQAMAELRLLRVRTDHLIWSMLTPEQRKQGERWPRLGR